MRSNAEEARGRFSFGCLLLVLYEFLALFESYSDDLTRSTRPRFDWRPEHGENRAQLTTIFIACVPPIDFWSIHSFVVSVCFMVGAVERSGKLLVVDTILSLWKRQNHRALIFCQTRQMLDIVESMIESRYTSLCSAFSMALEGLWGLPSLW